MKFRTIRQSLTGWLRVIGLVFSLVLLMFPAVAQDTGETYDDPAGRYSLPVPTNWTVETLTSEDGTPYAELTDPDDRMKVHAIVITSEDAAEAVNQAWAIALPDFTFEPQQTQNAPSAQGIDETVVITQLTDDQTALYQGFAQRVGDQVYILLFSGEVAAMVERNAQIQIIASGFKINTVADDDLTEAEALAIDEAITSELEVFIAEYMEKLNVPGVAVAIVQGGEIVYEQGFGVRELGGENAVTPNTRMMIGSTTKPITTTMMAALVDDGLMAWDTPVVEVLPEFAVADPELTQTITIRNLVCACTGVPRRDLEWLLNDLSAEDIVESLETFRFFTDFGEAFQYSNQMVATGGYAATAAAGGEFGDLYNAYLALMQERIFDPIGMTNTTFSFEEVATSEDVASPHSSSLIEGLKPLSVETEALLSPLAPAGALWSTAHDMALFMLTQLGEGVTPDGTRIVSAENLLVIREPQIQVSANQSYGLGWFIDEYKGIPFIQHGGNTFGFTSSFAFVPDYDFGIVVMANANGTNLFNEGVRERLMELVFSVEDSTLVETLEFVLETSAESNQELADSLLDEIDAEVVSPYVGTLSSEVLGDITVTFEDGVLTIDSGEIVTTVVAAQDEETGEISYLTVDPPVSGIPLEFETDEDGTPIIVIDIATDRYVFRLQE